MFNLFGKWPYGSCCFMSKKEDLEKYPTCFQRPTGDRIDRFGIYSFISIRSRYFSYFYRIYSISLLILHCLTNFHTSSGSLVNRVFLYVIDYADSVSEVRFAPSRHSLIIFSVQNCKIAKISTVDGYTHLAS